MLVFLMAQLHSFGRVFLVIAVVPLGLIGIVLALLAFNRPLGFVAILGILALVGMIARNAVILIDQIETERAQGREIWDAVVEATVSRFRPIMLTAISTVLGMIPIAPTVFWGPDGFRHHGRPLRRDDADAARAARLLHHALWRQAVAKGGGRRSRPWGRRAQNEPNALPRPITATSAISAPTIATMTMSR